MEQARPDYYNRGSIEVWDFIRDQGLNYHLGNAVKYICRAGHKESAILDLYKAIEYIQNELSYIIPAGAGIPDSVQRTEWDRVPHEAEEFDR